MFADFETYLTWDSDDSLARLIAAADEAGIRYTVVMPKTEVEPQNDRLARDRLRVIDGDHERRSVVHLRRAADVARHRGEVRGHQAAHRGQAGTVGGRGFTGNVSSSSNTSSRT